MWRTFCHMSGSVVVGVAAIVVASAFNVLALKRSSTTLALAERTYARTEERYRADRIEAYNAQLRDALIDVSCAVAAWNIANAWYVKLLKDLVGGNIAAGPVQDQDVEELRPAAREVYRTGQLVRFLSADERIVPILDRIDRSVIAGAKLVEQHGLTVNKILSAEREFARLRNEAAASASELMQVAKEVITPPKFLSGDDGAGPQS